MNADKIFKQFSSVMAFSAIGIMILIVIVLVTQSAPVWQEFGLDFAFGSDWNPVEGRESYGVRPYVYGTLITSFLALLLAVPISIGIAIFLSELAPPIIREPLSFIVELLAAVPSVIYGLWGLFIFRFYIRDYIEEPVINSLGDTIPIFSGIPFGLDLFTAGIILAVMIIPTISSVAREVIYAVPATQKEAAYALGATRWEMMRTSVFNYAKSGLFGACILGLGRAVGETMAVTMVIGTAIGAQALPESLFQPGQSMASIIANEFNEADPGSLHPSALIGVGLILFFFALIIQLFSLYLRERSLKVGEVLD